MAAYQNLIRQYPELGEILAEYENRLLFLENSQHFHQPEKKENIQPEPKWIVKQWDKVQQLEAEVKGWRQKHAELMLIVEQSLSSKRKKGKYTIVGGEEGRGVVKGG